MKVGRKANDPRVYEYMVRLDLPDHWNPNRDFPKELLDQLDACKDDASRRILLGVSK